MEQYSPKNGHYINWAVGPVMPLDSLACRNCGKRPLYFLDDEGFHVIEHANCSFSFAAVEQQSKSDCQEA